MRCFTIGLAATALVFLPAVFLAANFESAWPKGIERVWAGPEYWANPLQDWRIRDGRLECIVSGGNRNVHLLTRQLGPGEGDLIMSVRLGRIDPDETQSDYGWGGFRLGIRGFLDDYRNAAIWGKGFNAGITTAGELFLLKPGDPVT